MKAEEFFVELEKQNLSRLEKMAGVSRQALHGALKSKNMKLVNLKSVAKSMRLELWFSPEKTETNLLASLARFGVPVAHSKDGNLPFEEVVRESLLMARKDGAYESFVPFLLVQNVDKVKPLKLAARAFETNEVNVLGYFVELANDFKAHPALFKLLQLLEVAKNPKSEFLLRNGKTNFPELFEKNPLALKWNLKVRGTVGDHRERWVKWVQSRKAS